MGGKTAMDEFNNIQENTIEDKREVIKQKLRQYYDGRIVRKDLTKSIREGANVPVYVLEYLLGQYCNSDDEEIIQEGQSPSVRELMFQSMCWNIFLDNIVILMMKRLFKRV